MTAGRAEVAEATVRRLHLSQPQCGPCCRPASSRRRQPAPSCLPSRRRTLRAQHYLWTRHSTRPAIRPACGEPQARTRVRQLLDEVGMAGNGNLRMRQVASTEQCYRLSCAVSQWSLAHDPPAASPGPSPTAAVRQAAKGCRSFEGPPRERRGNFLSNPPRWCSPSPRTRRQEVPAFGFSLPAGRYVERLAGFWVRLNRKQGSRGSKNRGCYLLVEVTRIPKVGAVHVRGRHARTSPGRRT